MENWDYFCITPCLSLCILFLWKDDWTTEKPPEKTLEIFISSYLFTYFSESGNCRRCAWLYTSLTIFTMQVMKTFWKILSTLLITVIWAGITCGGNMFIATSSVLGDFIQKLNDALGLGSEPYTWPNILWILWFIEIVFFLGFSIWFFFWKYESLDAKGKKIVTYIIGAFLILLLALPFLGYFLAFINAN